MAGFTAKDPSDRNAFNAHWVRSPADPMVVARTIVVDGRVVGHIAKWELDGKPQVTCWIGRDD